MIRYKGNILFRFSVRTTAGSFLKRDDVEQEIGFFLPLGRFPVAGLMVMHFIQTISNESSLLAFYRSRGCEL
jgi:hypothetical protein